MYSTGTKNQEIKCVGNYIRRLIYKISNKLVGSWDRDHERTNRNESWFSLPPLPMFWWHFSQKKFFLHKKIFLRKKFTENIILEKKFSYVIFFECPWLFPTRSCDIIFKKLKITFYYLEKFDPGEELDFRCLNFHHTSRMCPFKKKSRGVG